LVDNLGSLRYFSLMNYVKAMVGNSSSGLIEAPSFYLPVVNVGIRQEGRVRAKNVIDVPCETDTILQAIHKATSEEFAGGLKDLENPYKKDGASSIIVDKLKSVRIDSNFLTKTFYDL
jgi:GDP/UDP-N,N'-diacetylbacillosamine 2-epimerase (hydrolysing)